MTTAERQLAWIWGGLVLAIAALSPVWVLLAPWLRPCIFRSVTGVPCPSCGATRGVLALIDGRLIDAFILNPLLSAGVLAFVAGGLIAPLWAWRVGSLPRVKHPLPRWVRYAIVLAIIANWWWVIAVL